MALAFVTGGAGFIGGHLVRALAGRGWEVRALVHRTELPQKDGVEAIRGDVRDPGVLRSGCAGVDIVFHLAAAVGSAVTERAAFRDVNARGTEAVLAAARDARVRRVVHVSSAGVLGAVEPGVIADETYPPNPRNLYDRTKWESERAAQRAAESGADIVIVRPGWVYGPGDRRTFKLIKAVHDGRFFFLAGTKGRQTPIHVEDLVAGLLQGAEKGAAGELYHLAGEVMSVEDMVAAIAAACGRRVPRFRLPKTPTVVAAAALEAIFGLLHKEAPLNRGKLSFFLHPKALTSEKAKRELGFSPRRGFVEGMSLTVAWYRRNGWLPTANDAAS
ncbi:MAG: NAD-dependent epimerase/dehydratase family protein [Candidatus Aminicenantes bacterium]|nr:NAD-dependent epimerase/dehydratase family protein [Candidatus Aminicenantes bacterium]